MKYIILLLLLVTIACTPNTDTGQIIPIQYHGALRNIMKKGDLSAKFYLDTISDRSNLYALGAIENLKGEILIFDGEPYHTSVHNDSIIFDNSYDINATLFVSAKVDKWTAYEIPSEVHTKNQLEKHVESIAKSNGINVSKPFPFTIVGAPQSLDWHIIDWPEGDTEHSHEKHIRSGLYGQLKGQNVEMIGFYSDSHHAVFTHHTTNMHIHMITSDHSIAGHVDDLTLGSGMILKLPTVDQSGLTDPNE